MTEAEEIAETMPLTGLDTYNSCRDRVRAEMPDETTTVVDNVAEALFFRLRATQKGIRRRDRL